jgi:hypothetical protein
LLEKLERDMSLGVSDGDKVLNEAIETATHAQPRAINLCRNAGGLDPGILTRDRHKLAIYLDTDS